MRRLLLALGVLLALAVLLVAAAPWLARPLLERTLSAALGQPVSIATLGWDTARGSLVAEGISVGSAPDLLTVERVTVLADLAALDRRHVTIARISVDKPSGAVALDAQYRPLLGSSGNGGGGPPSLPIAVTVREVVVSEGTILVHRPEPGAAAATVHIRGASVSDLELGAGGALRFAARLEATVNDAPLTADATVQLSPEGRQISATVDAKKIPVGAGLIPLPAAAESLTGTLDAKAELEIADQPAREELRLALRLADARLQGPRGSALAAAAVSVPKARIDLDQRRVDLGTVTLEKPRLTIDLAAADTDTDSAAAATDDDGPDWSVRSDTVTVRAGEVRLRRGEAAATLRLETVRWQGLRDTPATLAITAQSADGGRLAADGTVTIDPLAVQLAVRADALAVRPWAGLVDLPLQPARGTVSGSLQVDYRDGLRRVAGDLRADDLQSAPPDPARPAEVMAVATANAAFVVVPGGTPAVEVTSLTLSYPYAMVIRRPDGTFPYSVLAGRPPGDAAPKAGATAPAPTVRVRQAAVADGKLEFVDETLTPAFWTNVTDVIGSADEFALPAFTVEHFELAGKRDELSPVVLSGAIGADGLRGRAEVKGILPDSLNAYVAPVLGYKIVSGRLSTVATARSEPPRLRSTAEVVLYGLDVLQTGSDVIYEQSGVPLPVALGLISSAGGQIELTLPVSIDTRSGSVSVGSVVWQAVRKAIVTALTSPLRILGSLFGSKGAPHAFAVDPIPFPTGSAAVDAAAAQRIGEIARILQAHQRLVLVLLPQVTADDIGAVGSDGAAALARQRNAAVRGAFVDGEPGPSLPEKRLILSPWKPSTGATATGRPGVYVELQDAS